MKTFTLSFILILFMMSNMLFGQYGYDYLSVNDPQRTNWYFTYKGSITEATLNIKPHGTYLEYDLYLTLKATVIKYDYHSYSYSQPFNTETQLETVMQFTLPPNSFITDSWLWVGDSIMQALLIDKWTARSIYEGIVDRKKDPSVLYKYSDNSYELRVYPIKTTMNRKLKISYMVPFTFGKEYITAPLPINIIKTSDTIPNLNVTIFPESVIHNPMILEYSDIAFTKSGSTFSTMIPSAKIKAGSMLNVALPNPSSNGLFFNKISVNGENYYQMSFTPADLLGITKKRKIAVILDFEPIISGYYSYYYYNNYQQQKQPVTIAQMQSNVKYAIMSQLSPTDSFIIFYNHSNIVQKTATWVAATQTNIETYFSSLSTLMTSGTLLDLTLPQAVDFISKNNSEGSVLIVANTDEYYNDITKSKTIVKNTLDKMRPGNIPVNVIDVATSYSGTYDNQTYYRGNDYLYSNITRTTQGNYFSTSKTQESLGTMLVKGLQQIDGKMSVFDYHLSMQNGYCFSRFGKDASQNYYNKPIVEYGKFDGSLPFTLELNAKIDTTFIHKTITIDQTKIDNSTLKTNKIWAGNYIKSLETASTYSDDIADVIKASMDNRVLCMYTAFLALEPSDSVHACQDCNEYSMGNDSYLSGAKPYGVTTSLNPVKTDSTINAGIYPNPFTESTTISMRVEEKTSVSIVIYNIHGQLIKSLYNVGNVSAQNIEVNWTGDDDSGNSVSPGIYLIVIGTDSGKKVLKVIKQ